MLIFSCLGSTTSHRVRTKNAWKQQGSRARTLHAPFSAQGSKARSTKRFWVFCPRIWCPVFRTLLLRCRPKRSNKHQGSRAKRLDFQESAQIATESRCSTTLPSNPGAQTKAFSRCDFWPALSNPVAYSRPENESKKTKTRTLRLVGRRGTVFNFLRPRVRYQNFRTSRKACPQR